jgi:hypothetical protein
MLQSPAGHMLGAMTTPLGVVLLPHAHGNTLLTVFSLTSIAVGILVATSCIVSRIVARLI